MKAIVYDKKHSPYKLKYCDAVKPVPSNTEVLIKVISASINAADYRSMKMGMVPKKGIFGGAISGIVESTGKNIHAFKAGDEVLGDMSDCGFGGFAEYAVASEDALVIKPPSLSFENAATLPIAATTALKALRDIGEIQKGQKVLIVGASGGVGTFAVQLAKYFGATVTAVCSERNTQQTISLGADKVIDYAKEDFIDSINRYDLIVAINGNYPILGYRRILKSQGTYVMVGGSMTQIFKSIFFGWLLSFGGKRMKSLSAKSDPKDLAYVTKLMDEGEIRAIKERHYSLECTEEAWAYMSKGHAQGKVIINIQERNSEHPLKPKLY